MNNEYYVLSIIKTSKDAEANPLLAVFNGSLDKFYVVIKSRKELSEIYALMGKTYRVENITALNGTKSFEEFKKELTEGDNNKPKGLNFGQEDKD